jgi:hypothetical protein
MPRTMFDAITPGLIPDGPPMVAGYVNGWWPSYAELVSRFPAAVHVSIAVNTSADAQVLDCETGDATPDECPGWAARQTARGQTPTIYCNTTTWPAVVAAFTAQGVPVPLWWAAQYDDTPRMYPGAVAKQHTNTPGYDVSIVADYWPGIDPAPIPTPPAPTTEDDNMLSTFRNSDTGEIVTAAPGHWRTVENPAYLDLDAARGVIKTPPVELSAAEFGYFRGVFLAEPVDAAILAELDTVAAAVGVK